MTLTGGGPAPSMIWLEFSEKPNVPLEPGETGEAQLFSHHSVAEGARPAHLRIDGRVFDWR